MTGEISTAGTWEAADDSNVESVWPSDLTPTKSPYGTPEDQTPVAVQQTATESRYAKVNRDSEGVVLGIALFLNETELCRLGAELDKAEEIKYWVEDGRLRFAKADSTENEVSSKNDG
ncbi:hypothetical protein [Halobacterium bonnevillei]|uniref:Uncharacterized protein n=1 Tax=Halobacterium bonnevillei TaxID=2692200 RepID=A0A6B0SV74_9EURY|nr:hypothetical protein [Halobacterium bonnevillei]MXR21419.1 hypothetical protein [Halobacterium bonnevillei]